MGERVNRYPTGPDATRARKTGEIDNSDVDMILDGSYEVGSQVARDAWNNLKPGLARNLVSLADAFINTSDNLKHSYGPFGLLDYDNGEPLKDVSPRDGEDALTVLFHAMEYTLTHDLDIFLGDYYDDKVEDPIVRQAFPAASRIITFGREIAQIAPQVNRDIRTRLRDGGAITAPDVKTRMIEWIASTGASLEDKRVRMSGYRPVTLLANRHASIFSALLFKELWQPEGRKYRGWGVWHFKPDAFYWSDKGIEIDEEKMTRAAEKAVEIRKKYPESQIETGCPALYSDAMVNLWNRHVDTYLLTKNTHH